MEEWHTWPSDDQILKIAEERQVHIQQDKDGDEDYHDDANVEKYDIDACDNEQVYQHNGFQAFFTL